MTTSLLLSGHDRIENNKENQITAIILHYPSLFLHHHLLLTSTKYANTAPITIRVIQMNYRSEKKSITSSYIDVMHSVLLKALQYKCFNEILPMRRERTETILM